MPVFIVCCLMLLVHLCVIPSAESATRLGLHVTAEEKTIWQARMTDNVNTINGFTYASIYQNRLKVLADAFVAQAHPGGDGMWTGNTTGGCINTYPAEQTYKPGRGNGHMMAVSAFVFLLTGTTTYATGVEANLLALSSDPNLDFANAAKFCIFNSYQNGVEIHPWLSKLIFAYDYLNAGGYTGLSAGEKTQIETWLKNGALYFLNSLKIASSQGLYPYNGLFQTPPSSACSQHCSATGPPWYFGGHATAIASDFMNTVSSGGVNLAMLAGVLTNTASMVLDATNWFTNAIPVASNNLGVVEQVYRAGAGVDSGTGHAAGVYGAFIQAADTLARTGNTSLYDVATATLVPGSAPGTVSLGLVARKFARMSNSTEPIYVYNSGAQGPEISWDTDLTGFRKGTLFDFVFMASNLYYQNAEVTTAMTRATLGTNTYLSPSACNDSQFGSCFGGVASAFWPDLPFMYGNMEGVVDPYGAGQNFGPTLSITTPTTYASTTVSGATVTISGPATDDVGVTQVTWTCPQCQTTSGSASCAPACGASTTSTTWTITALPLPATGQTATLTVTASDGTQTAQDILSIHRQDTANLQSGLELQFPFDESSGTTTADASGQGHTGTLQTGATFGVGETGNGVVLDGVTGRVTVSGTLTSPAALTLAGWIQLSGGMESATVLNIADAIGLRIDSPNSSRTIKGFYFAGGSSWPNLSGTTPFPASGWHHLAYTLDSTRQVLYLDGVVIAMDVGVISGPNYSTGNTTTSLGRHPFSAAWDLQGTLDDVRVYTRALSEIDIEALVSGTDPVEPAIQITAPNGGNDTPVNTSPIATLLGVASDSDGTVSSVSVSCIPSCGSPTVTGLTEWSVASLPLVYGRNIVTVTVTDNDTLTNSDSITITRYCPADITAELELWLDLDGDATDSSGAGRHGTPTGITYTAGVVGTQAAVFDGSTSQIAIASLLDTPPTITLTAWAFLTGFPETRADILSLGDYVNLQPTASTLAGWYYTGSDTWVSTTANATLLDGWHHLAYVLMPGEQRLYLDGTFVGTPSTHQAPIDYTTLGTGTMVGNNANGGIGNVQGRLDDVRVYGCPQDAAGIQAIEDYAGVGSVNLSAPLSLRCLSCQ